MDSQNTNPKEKNLVRALEKLFEQEQPQQAMVDPKAPTQKSLSPALKKKKELRKKFQQQPASNTLDPDTEQGRINLTKELVLAIKDLLSRANILNRQAEKALGAKNRQEFKEQLILMSDGLVSLKEKDVPKLIKTYLMTVKQYERQRGREIPVQVKESTAKLETLLKFLMSD